ncbi:MAG: hypothetical protein ACE5G7_03095 [Candidatus Hydrothermarchaeaceae archaeon]
MKFGNTANKVKAILSVIRNNERVKGRDIAQRLSVLGYRVDEGHINMFIYHNMLYKYLERKRIKGINYYTLV